MPTTYTVSQAARLLGVSVSTVRRIADEFSDTLPDYQPERGRPRTLSDADVRTLWAILEGMRTSGMGRSQFRRSLEAGQVQLVIPATLPAPVQEGPQIASQTHQEGQEGAERQIGVSIPSPPSPALLRALEQLAQEQARIAQQIAHLEGQQTTAGGSRWARPVTVAAVLVLVAGIAAQALGVAWAATVAAMVAASLLVLALVTR